MLTFPHSMYSKNRMEAWGCCAADKFPQLKYHKILNTPLPFLFPQLEFQKKSWSPIPLQNAGGGVGGGGGNYK